MKKIKQAIHRFFLRRVAQKYGQEIVNAWIYFTLNYPMLVKDWMIEIYGQNMGQHFYEKFDYFYEKYGTRAAFTELWASMTTEHRKTLFRFFQEKYANGQYF